MRFGNTSFLLFTAGTKWSNKHAQRQSAPVSINNRHQFSLPDLAATQTFSHILRNRYASQHGLEDKIDELITWLDIGRSFALTLPKKAKKKKSLEEIYYQNHRSRH